MIHRIWHWLQHQFGWNHGTVEVWTDPDGTVMVGFLCECGELRHVGPIPKHVLQR